MSFIWDISSSPPISSHKKRDNVLCPQWKPRLICQIQLQSIVIQPCGLKTVCAEVAFRGRLSGSDTRQRMVLLFQSHERDSRIWWGVQFFFSICKTSRNGDARRLIRVAKKSSINLKRIKESRCLNRNIFVCWRSALFIFLFFQTRLHSFLLMKHNRVLFWRWSNAFYL